jgi:protease-4
MLELLQYRAWLLSEAYYDNAYRLLNSRLQLGHDLDGLVKKQTAESIDAMISAYLSVDEGHPPMNANVEMTISYDEPTGLRLAKVNGKSIALISMVGPLTKRGELCSYGMMHYQQMLNRVNSAAHIDGSVLIMDTPGGTVDGTPELGLAVRTSAKPVGVFGDGMVASAGMWIASQAQVVVGNKNNPTQFGSIGVLMMLPNYQNVMDAGFLPKMKIYRADQSYEKALVNAIEPITEDAERQLQSDLNGIASMFIGTVKHGRGAKLDVKAPGLFTGRMFDVYESKKMGLIDAIGTLQTAINKVAELAKQQKAQTQINTDEVP